MNHLRFFALALSCGLLSTPVVGAEQWLTGPALQKKLAQVESMAWADTPLRAALKQFAAAQHVAFLIDRRVDPGQRVELQLQNRPLEAMLREVAASQKLAVSLAGPVAYFGPPKPTARLRTLAALREEEVRKLPLVASRRLLQLQPMAWDDLATPRQLLEELAKQGGVEIVGLEQIPHDLWAAADMPPLALVERLTVILNQFDLTFETSRDGKELTLVPVPDDVGIVRSYPGGGHADALLKSMQALAPTARFKVVGDRVYVKGMIEDLEQMAAPKRTAVRTPPGHRAPRITGDDFATKRFTLRVVEKPIGLILEQLAAQMNLELKIDRAGLQKAGFSLDERVSLDVTEATIDELLQAAIKTVPLRYYRKGRVLEIGAMERPAAAPKSE